MAVGAVALYLRFVKIPEVIAQMGSTDFTLIARKLFAMHLLTFVFSEVISLFGFSAFIVHSDPRHYGTLYLGGLILMLLCFPRVPTLSEG
jgi:hypothetical protein